MAYMFVCPQFFGTHRCAHVHPPAGHFGMPDGTLYVANRCHGVLVRLV